MSTNQTSRGRGNQGGRGNYVGDRGSFRGGRGGSGGQYGPTRFNPRPPVFTGEVVLIAHNERSWRALDSVALKLFKACRESGQQQSERGANHNIYMVTKNADNTYVFSTTTLGDDGQPKVVKRSIKVVQLDPPALYDNGVESEEENSN